MEGKEDVGLREGDTKWDDDDTGACPWEDGKEGDCPMPTAITLSDGVPVLPAWMLDASITPRMEGETTRPHTTATHVLPSGVTMPLSPTALGVPSPVPVAGRADDDPRARAILSGFSIVSLGMRNGDSGKVIWEAQPQELETRHLFSQHLEAHLPAATLQATSVTRQLTFSSKESMRDFFIIQRLYLSGVLIEEYEFTFGFVIPGSTNSWEQITEADTDSGVLPLELLSGHLVVETEFYDKGLHITTAVVRIFYDR